jgi:hypothetical protein
MSSCDMLVKDTFNDRPGIEERRQQGAGGVYPAQRRAVSNRLRPLKSITRTLASPTATASAISRFEAPSTWPARAARGRAA